MTVMSKPDPEHEDFRQKAALEAYFYEVHKEMVEYLTECVETPNEEWEPPITSSDRERINLNLQEARASLEKTEIQMTHWQLIEKAFNSIYFS